MHRPVADKRTRRGKLGARTRRPLPAAKYVDGLPLERRRERSSDSPPTCRSRPHRPSYVGTDLLRPVWYAVLAEFTKPTSVEGLAGMSDRFMGETIAHSACDPGHEMVSSLASAPIVRDTNADPRAGHGFAPVA